MEIRAIQTWGQPHTKNFVSSYSLHFCDDGKGWRPVTGKDGEDEVLTLHASVLSHPLPMQEVLLAREGD